MGPKIHLVGIGGIGMSGLAKYLAAEGYIITGSDLRKNELTAELERRGIVIHEGHSEKNISPGISRVIYSAAVREDNIEILTARRLGIKTLKYAAMLGEIVNSKSGIAVAGSHGKTTITAMISYILNKGGLMPSFICGGIIPQLGGNSQNRKGKHIVVEACEYDRSFLNLRPYMAVVANIEEDHLDYYSNLGEIMQATLQFLSQVHPEGFIIYNLDDQNVGRIIRDLSRYPESYSISRDADWRARAISIKEGRWRFEVLRYGKLYGEFTLGIPGIHNVANALPAIAVCNHIGVGREIIQVALAEFQGVKRRFEILGEMDRVVIVDDYAHHPTEIQVTLRTVRERFPDRKIWCIFQPHQHSRTRIFLKEFSRSFGEANLIILTDIFSARDPQVEMKRISSEDLASQLDLQGKAALYLPTFDKVISFVKSKIEPGSVLVTLGAGNVGEIGRRFLRERRDVSLLTL
jgi:UDP-N-acetylmuramate--alanine ligase